METDAVYIAAVRDGRRLCYDGRRYRFYLSGEPVPLKKVRCMDAHGALAWKHLEQRDWMRRLSEEALEEHARRASLESGDADGSEDVRDGEIAEHVRRDDGYIHGRIVDADADAAVRQEAFAEERRRMEERQREQREELRRKEEAEAPILKRREEQLEQARRLSEKNGGLAGMRRLLKKREKQG